MIRVHTLVVGGGPAGSTAARFLASRGIETLLVERDLSYVKPCGGAIPSYALQELGIPAHVVRRQVGRIRIVPPRSEDLVITFPEGHLCITERGTFDRVLREMAAEAGAVIEESAFTGFEQRDGTVVSLIRRRSTKETIRVRSDYVVACNGITNSTGSSLALRRKPVIYTMSTHLAHTGGAALPGYDAECCEFWFGADHASNLYSWVFPSLDFASIGTGSPDAGQLGQLFERFLRRRFGSREAEVSAESLFPSRKVFPIPLWDRSVLSFGNILFAGDAAGTVMPVTYEGIYYAMKSGELAAMAIADGNPRIYRTLWDERFRRRFTVMRMIKGSFFKSERHIEKWVALHRKPEIQDLAIRLWLRKETGSRGLATYVKAFRQILAM